MFTLLSSIALAVPMELTHSGRLMDSTGLPLDGAHDIEVSLHTAASGGSQAWSEALTGVECDDGYFSVVLGTDTLNNPLDPAAFELAALWVEVSVDGTVVGDRLPVSSVPWAIRADTATNVEGGIVDVSEVRIDGTTVLGGGSAGTLSSLACTTGQVAVYDGTEWDCADPSTGGGPPVWTDIIGIPTGFADGVDDDTLASIVCIDGQITAWNAGSSAWVCTDPDWSRLLNVPADLLDGDADTQLTEAEVDVMVANNGYALSTDLATVATSGAYADLSGTPTLSTVAISGSYTDLSNTPTLATVATTGLYSDVVGAPIIADVGLSGVFADLVSIPAGLSDGDDDTQLSDAEVDAFVVNNALPGDVLLGSSGSASCANANAGALRWDGTALRLCDGATWRVLAQARPEDGSSAANAALSCKTLHAQYADLQSGMYWIDPSGSDPQSVFCDMQWRGGGWTLCYDSDVDYDTVYQVTGWQSERNTANRGSGTYARDCRTLTADLAALATVDARVVYVDQAHIEARSEPAPSLNNGTYTEFSAIEGPYNIGIEINNSANPGRGHCFDNGSEDNSWGRAGVSQSCYLDTQDGIPNVWYSGLRHVEYWLR